MRRVVLFLLFSAWGAALGQQVSEESVVINVEVPVRVFNGSVFVDTLSAADFEVFEDGVPQKIEAVYLVKKRTVARREEEKAFKPVTARNFYLFFEISEFVPRLDEALRYFVFDVLVPGDNVVLVTPVKTYHMLGEAAAAKRKEDILSQLQGLLRRDTAAGTSEYRDVLLEMEKLARAMSQLISGATASSGQDSVNPVRMDLLATPENVGRTMGDLLQRYSDLLSQMETIRTVDQQRLLDFSNYLKKIEGQKYVFLFYQREFIPRIDPKILYQYIDLYQDRPDIQHRISDLFEFYRREFTFSPELIRRAFADSLISSHFLFITPPAEVMEGVRLQEQSNDVYAAFKEIARASGGFIEDSANPAFLMKNAVAAAENYYLLYYSPRTFLRDGKFKEIRVRVKNSDYRAVYRQGYFAR
jgi:hypothetical protein